MPGRLAPGREAGAVWNMGRRTMSRSRPLALGRTSVSFEGQLALAEPKPAGAQVRFKLSDARIQRRLAAIDLPQALAKMFGQLRHLKLQLLPARFEIEPGYCRDHLRRGLFDLQPGLTFHQPGANSSRCTGTRFGPGYRAFVRCIDAGPAGIFCRCGFNRSRFMSFSCAHTARFP